MKCVLLSVRPQFVAKILNKEKTIEVRKHFPKDYVGWVYIYCTKQNDLFKSYIRMGYYTTRSTADDLEYNGKGKVIARFWCDKVEEIRPLMCGNFYHIEYGLTTNQLNDYLNNKVGYAIHITKLEIFDKPKEISEFCNKREQMFVNGEMIYDHKFKITRAPQSFCFIEV